MNTPQSLGKRNALRLHRQFFVLSSRAENGEAERLVQGGYDIAWSKHDVLPWVGNDLSERHGFEFSATCNLDRDLADWLLYSACSCDCIEHALTPDSQGKAGTLRDIADDCHE
jgi:hypothetical protein